MTINYQLTAEDLMAFNGEFKRYAPSWLSRLYWSGLLPLLFALLAMAAGIAIATIFTIAFLLSSLVVSRWQAILARRAIFSAPNVRVQILPMAAILSDEGARFESEAGHILYKWQFIERVSRAGKYLRFTITPIECLYIPISAFRDDAHLNEFLAKAQSHLESRTG